MKCFLVIVVASILASLSIAFQPTMRSSRMISGRLQMASYKVHIIDKKNGVDATVDIDANEYILDGAERQVLTYFFHGYFFVSI